MLARRCEAVGFAVLAAWHPLHTTITTIVYDPAARRVTATVRVFEDDLGRAVSRGVHAAIQGTAPSDSASFAYVRSTLTFTARDGHPVPVAWCGSRTTGDLRWLCVQAIVPVTQEGRAGLGGLRIRDAVLTEVYDDQVNVVMADYDGRHESLLFTRGDGGKALP